MTLWRARDVYRARRGLKEWGILFLLLQVLMFVTCGRWDLLVEVVGSQLALICTAAWLLRKASVGGRTRSHVLLLGVLLLGAMLSGCQDVTRVTAKMYGLPDPYAPTPCATIQAGRCVPLAEGVR